MPAFHLASFVLALSLPSFLVNAQPAPELQERISQAIANAANESNPDYTSFVNVFIGTGRQHSLMLGTTDFDVHLDR